MKSDKTRSNPPKRRAVPPRARRAIWRGSTEFDRIEVMSAVCGRFIDGLTVAKIRAAMKVAYPTITLTRWDVYALIREAARTRYLSFTPPQHLLLTHALEQEFPWLRTVSVVHTATSRDVAVAGARSLMRLVRSCALNSGEEVHIGFSGGPATRALVEAFAAQLKESVDDPPVALVIHAMAAGFDPSDPSTDPNNFYSYFPKETANGSTVRFVGFSAPSLVPWSGIPGLRQMPDIENAYAAVKYLHIIVGSGSCWRDPHSALRNQMHQFSDCKRVLDEEGCVADVLWRPLTDGRPIERETRVRALTLVELSELPELIAQKTRVLLTIGPCATCNTPKGRLLACLLGQRRHIVTDLVADSRTVNQMNDLRSAVSA
jgi:hypothetical protein